MFFYLGGGFYVAVVLIALVLTVLALIFIVPQKKRERLNPFGRFLHDTFNFNYLVIEKILKAIYIFATVLTILVGFFMLFRIQPSYFGYGGGWMGGCGILVMLLGPIVIRIFYELMLLPILLVKHVAQINGKMKGEPAHDVFAAPDLTEMKEELHRRISQGFEEIDTFGEPESSESSVENKPE